MATGEGLGTSAAYALDPERTPHTYLELGALPTAVPCARLHVKHVLREWQMAQLADPVELIVAELVTNAMQASAGLTTSQFAGRWSPGLPPVRLWLAWTAGTPWSRSGTPVTISPSERPSRSTRRPGAA